MTSSSPNDWLECQSCDGFGRHFDEDDGEELGECWDCDGHGGYIMAACFFCEGKRYVKGEGICQRCNGEGKAYRAAYNPRLARGDEETGHEMGSRGAGMGQQA